MSASTPPSGVADRFFVQLEALATGPLAGEERHTTTTAHHPDAAQFQRLVSALAVVIGWGGKIVLLETRNLSRSGECRESTWTAHPRRRDAR